VVSAASSSRVFTFPTSSRRFSIASKRVRYPLTSRAMMSKSVNSEPRNADRFYPVDPARAGPTVKLLALGSSPRAHRALVDCGLWARTECRASSEHLTLFGTWGGLSLLAHPQPFADLVHETLHRTSLLRYQSKMRARNPPRRRRTLDGMPDEKRPDVRPQLREFLAWYEEVLGRIESGAIVGPGEQERLTEEASAVAHLLDLLDSTADEPAS